ncbi:MAG: hypothetical protein C4308_06530 [Chitinophagaceae bacterium]
MWRNQDRGKNEMPQPKKRRTGNNDYNQSDKQTRNTRESYNWTSSDRTGGNKNEEMNDDAGYISSSGRRGFGGRLRKSQNNNQ